MIYYIYGDDLYQKEARLNILIKDIDGNNISIHDNFESSLIKNDILTMPFLSDKKAVVLKNIIDHKNKSNFELLESTIGSVPAECELIFYEEKLVAQNTKLGKSLREIAKNEEYLVPKPAQIPSWIIKKSTDLGGKISNSDAQLLAVRVGNDLVALENEIKKLISFNPEITTKSIELLTNSQSGDNIFALMDAISAKNMSKCLNLLDEFMSQPDNESYLLSMITKQVRNMMIVKDLNERNNSEGQIASMTGLHPFVVKKTLQAIKKFSFQELKEIHKGALEIDEKIKSGQGDPKILLTNLLIKSCN